MSDTNKEMSDSRETRFVMDDTGRFHIEAAGLKSPQVRYQGIATITVDNVVKFIGVSAFYEGVVPIETVLKVEVLETTRSR